MACSRFVYRTGSIAILDVSQIERGTCNPTAPHLTARHGARR
jgi:hypothetical protein